MPNHVFHEVTVKGKYNNVKAFFDKYIKPTGLFSLKAITPMPKELNDTVSPLCAIEYGIKIVLAKPEETLESLGIPEYLINDKKKREEQINHALLSLKCKDLYGFYNWYEWANAKWGTKWDCYNFRNLAEDNINCTAVAADSPIELAEYIFANSYSNDEINNNSNVELSFTFDTAWKCPQQALKTLAEQIKHLELDIVINFADEDIGNNCGIVRINNKCQYDFEYIDTVEFACDVLGYDPEEIDFDDE